MLRAGTTEGKANVRVQAQGHCARVGVGGRCNHAQWLFSVEGWRSVPTDAGSRREFQRRHGQGSLPVRFLSSPGSADGTLNIPATITWHTFSPALNALDGWSTNAPIDTSFSQPIDPATVNGTSVKVLKLWVDYTTKAPCASASCLPAGATSPVAGVLTYGTDFVAEVSTRRSTPVGSSCGSFRSSRWKRARARPRTPVAPTRAR